MVLSIHDNLLISYEVQCESRTILLRTECRTTNQPTKFISVVFNGVQGYRFSNDAFGNIILDLEPMTVDQFIREYGADILASYNEAGSPGPWAKNLEAAALHLQAEKIQAFILASSFGLSGWVLAREMTTFSVDPPVRSRQR
jgi:hypothetical protein